MESRYGSIGISEMTWVIPTRSITAVTIGYDPVRQAPISLPNTVLVIADKDHFNSGGIC